MVVQAMNEAIELKADVSLSRQREDNLRASRVNKQKSGLLRNRMAPQQSTVAPPSHLNGKEVTAKFPEA